MNKPVALKYASTIRAIYPTLTTSVTKHGAAYAVTQSMPDGSYQTLLTSEDSCEEFIKIHG